MGSVRNRLPSCSSCRALSFAAEILKNGPETAKNDRFLVALRPLFTDRGRPSVLARTTTSGSIEPVCGSFWLVFSTEKTSYAFCIPIRVFCRKN